MSEQYFPHSTIYVAGKSLWTLRAREIGVSLEMQLRPKVYHSLCRRGFVLTAVPLRPMYRTQSTMQRLENVPKYEPTM